MRPLDNLRITNNYDALFRRTNLQAILNSPATTLSTAGYSYDNASRLASVSDGTYSAAYNYLANSPLVSQITYEQNTTTRMTTSFGVASRSRLRRFGVSRFGVAGLNTRNGTGSARTRRNPRPDRVG